MVDVAYCWSDWKEALRVARRLEKYAIFFLETPLPSDDLEAYARLADATDVRISAGEWLQTRFEFADLMDRGHVDLVRAGYRPSGWDHRSDPGRADGL